MESIISTTFRVGKLFHKQLLLEILTMSQSRDHCLFKLYFISRKSRQYLITYFRYFERLLSTYGSKTLEIGHCPDWLAIIERKRTKKGAFIPITLTWDSGQKNFVRLAQEITSSAQFKDKVIYLQELNYSMKVDQLDFQLLIVLKEMANLGIRKLKISPENQAVLQSRPQHTLAIRTNITMPFYRQLNFALLSKTLQHLTINNDIDLLKFFERGTLGLENCQNLRHLSLKGEKN